MQIQIFLEDDLKNLPAILPEGWDIVPAVFQTHINQPYFFPIKLVLSDPTDSENKMIGVAELIINGKIGWLGNIIVKKEFRNQGLGKKLTLELMKMAKEKECKSYFLLATSLGEFVYQKLGFQKKGKYLFFQTNLLKTNTENCNNIFTFQDKYQSQVFELDKKAMGEDRSEVLKLHLKNSFVYKKSGEEKISGFFMPDFGNGLTICNNEIASFDFIKKREELGINKIMLPEENTVVINFLKQRGYFEFREPATFMFLGKKKTWNPEMVVCRIGGYLG